MYLRLSVPLKYKMVEWYIMARHVLPTVEIINRIVMYVALLWTSVEIAVLTQTGTAKDDTLNNPIKVIGLGDAVALWLLVHR